MSLTEYRRKRRFTKTSEPKGRQHKASKRLEFVVQKHDASHLHYDFRLELGGVLKSWAVPKGPSLNPQDKRLAMMVEDHPYDYRTFEGEIPEGNYGAGDVIVWDRGWYEPREDTDDPQKTLRGGLHKGQLTFVLHGEKLQGEFALVKTKDKGDNAWLLIKKRDDYASTKDVTDRTESVKTGEHLPRDVPAPAELAAPKAKRPSRVKPMLATLTAAPFDDQDWIYEIKWDGYRAIGSWDGKTAQLYSRRGNDFCDKYPPVAEALQELAVPAVVDGEIIMADAAGKADFTALQNYGQGAKGTLLYYVFDILWYDGYDVRGLPLLERKELLKRLLGDDGIIRYSDHIVERGTDFFAMAEQQGLEGIMAKRADSKYKEGLRSKLWLKVKTHQRQEVVIGGYTEPKGSRKHIGALVMGVYENGKLCYVGHTGGGIPPKQLEPLKQQLIKLERKTSPFGNQFKPNAPVHWATPKLVAEVSFAEWTKDGHMRQPIFVGLRTDKDPTDVHKELPVAEPTEAKSTKRPAPKKQSSAKQSKTTKMSEQPPTKPRHFEFSHPDKVFWPEAGYTKGDLIDYYQTVLDTMLPYIQDRPCNLLRQPNGYKGKSFFQKDMAERSPDWLTTISVYSDSNEKDIDYLVCEDAETLLYQAQLGCIEINPWNSRVQSLEKPDWTVIDLDPEGVGFKDVVKVAQVVHDVCDELKIPSYPKTSGKTGIHVFIPLGAKYSYEQCRQFAQLLASLVHDRTRDITSLERNPKKREHKIYLDYLQNRQSQTLAAPYCVRPTKAASVSTPLDWDEVNAQLDPANFTIKTMPDRLKRIGDIWAPVLGPGIDMAAIVRQLEP